METRSAPVKPSPACHRGRPPLWRRIAGDPPVALVHARRQRPSVTEREAKEAGRTAEAEVACRRSRRGDETVAGWAGRWLDLKPRQKESTNIGYREQVRPARGAPQASPVMMQPERQHVRQDPPGAVVERCSSNHRIRQRLAVTPPRSPCPIQDLRSSRFNVPDRPPRLSSRVRPFFTSQLQNRVAADRRAVALNRTAAHGVSAAVTSAVSSELRTKHTFPSRNFQ